MYIPLYYYYYIALTTISAHNDYNSMCNELTAQNIAPSCTVVNLTSLRKEEKHYNGHTIYKCTSTTSTYFLSVHLPSNSLSLT